MKIKMPCTLALALMDSQTAMEVGLFNSILAPFSFFPTVESKRDAVIYCLVQSQIPFSHPAHRTGRAVFPHPALRLDSLQNYRYRLSSGTFEFMHAQMVENLDMGVLVSAPRGHFVTPLQEASHRLPNMSIDGTVTLALAAIVKVSLPPF